MSNQQPIDERRGNTSASNALADSLCLGRHLAQAGLPDTSSADSLRGDRIHRALAYNLQHPGSVEQDNPKFLGVEERECFDMIREDERKVLLSFFGDPPPGPFRAFREQRYWGTVKTPAGVSVSHSGKADVVFRAGPRALIADYKTGRDEVEESPRNLQLRDLAVLVRGNMLNLQEVGTVIFQPYVSREPVVCIYTAGELDQAAQEMWARVDACNRPNQPRTPGEGQCHFCKARRQCVEHLKWAAQITPPAMLGVMEVPMTAWTPEQRAVAAGALGPAVKLLEDLKAFLKEGIAKDPSFVPGWGLSDGRRTETIVDPTECFKRFVGIGGTQEAFMRCVKVGKTNLKEAVAAATSAKGKALESAMKALTDGIVTVNVSEGSLKKLEGK